MAPLVGKKSRFAAASQCQQPLPTTTAVVSGESFDDDNVMSRNLDATTKITERKVFSSNCHGSKRRVRDPMALLLLSFPMKLHLILKEYEYERHSRRCSNCKRQKKDDGKDGIKNRDDNEAGSSSSGSCKDKRTNANKHANANKDDIIIGWLPKTDSFKIYDEERFVREIMPSYFLRHSNKDLSFETFQRNLYLWGFSQMMCVEGPTTRMVHVCSHPFFIKGKPRDCIRMRFRT